MTPRRGPGPGPRRRGRPIARTAVIGGAAYHAGKSVQSGRSQQAAQDQQIADLETQQAQQPPPQPAAAAPDVTVELQKLADLNASGALTDDEFAAAKAKLLGI